MSDARDAEDEPGFSVWRQDEHGNRFEVTRGLSAADAARALERFEASQHKQTYWIEPTR